MKRNSLARMFILITVLFLSTCTILDNTHLSNTEIIENTKEPNLISNTKIELTTNVPTSTITITPRPTITKTTTPTPSPILLSSPFSSDCGDGPPRIWSNDSFNGVVPQDYLRYVDQHHGHVDIFVPEGCNPSLLTNELLAPFSGRVEHVQEDVYLLYLDTQRYPSGIINALNFIGISNPDLNKISTIYFNFGHISANPGNVIKGQPIGEVVGGAGHWKIAYKVYLTYDDIQYEFSPTLLDWEVKPICHSNSWYDCEPEKDDYAP